MEILLFIAGAALFFGALLTWPVWANSHSRTLVGRWAAKNGLALVRAEVTNLATSQFPGYVRGQVIWAVRTRNPQGQVRDAWIRCGGTSLGFHLDDLEVRWAASGHRAI